MTIFSKIAQLRLSPDEATWLSIIARHPWPNDANIHKIIARMHVGGNCFEIASHLLGAPSKDPLIAEVGDYLIQWAAATLPKSK
ncbi:MAG: hypothetical protein WC761_00915 [Candidatus Paceibacterota bacterium]|jgi:hypothetical protein